MISFANFAVSCIALAALPAARGAIFDVVVGGTGILKYTPESVNANVGDVVRFVFKQKNHTATQSTLANPCVRVSSGFDSGFVPVADSVVSGFPVAELNVTSTDPVWVYCRQSTHCQAGMVFAVNPGDKMDAFKAAATGATPSSSTAASQTATATSTSNTATTISTDHRIVVGGPGILTFSPSNITTQVGDTVTFEFHQKNHTVTASSFDAPCRSLAETSTGGVGGFDSGFMPVADSATVFPTFTIQINDTKPIWAYCRQNSHCGQGMVFSVNAVESGPKNFSAFQALAKQLNGTSTTGGGSYGNGSVRLTGFGNAVAIFFASLVSFTIFL